MLYLCEKDIMGYNIFKTRKGKLEADLQLELSSKNPNLQKIITIVNNYEKSNLKTIEKLKRNQIIDSKRISGGLRATINAHGPITKLLIGSATKRVYGSLLDDKPKPKYVSSRRLTWIMFEITVWVTQLVYFIYLLLK